MSTDLHDQMHELGRVLRHLAPPIDIDEVRAVDDRAQTDNDPRQVPSLSVVSTNPEQNHAAQRSRRIGLIAAAIVLVVGAGGIAAVLTRPDSARPPADSTPTQGQMKIVPATPPAGLQLTQSWEPPPADFGPDDDRLVLGTQRPDGTYGQLISVSTGPKSSIWLNEGNPEQKVTVTPITAGGAPGSQLVVCDPTSCDTTWLQIPIGDRAITVAAGGTPTDSALVARLAAVADSISTVDGHLAITRSLPDGYVAVYATPTSIGARKGLQYSDLGGTGRYLIIQTEDSPPSGYQYRDATQDLTPISVRGHQGFYTQAAQPANDVPVSELDWLENSNTLISLKGPGYTAAQLVAIAESLQQVTDAQWASIAATAHG